MLRPMLHARQNLPIDVRQVELLLMHPHEVEGDLRRLAQQPARPRLPVAVVVTVIVASVVAVVWRSLGRRPVLPTCVTLRSNSRR